MHKLRLEVFAHNAAAIALYRKCGFVEEGRRARQYRQASGELWNSIVIGLAGRITWLGGLPSLATFPGWSLQVCKGVEAKVPARGPGEPSRSNRT